jgi:hypothetical protein
VITLSCCCPATGDDAPLDTRCVAYEINAPPAEWELDEVHTQCILVEGFPIVASAKVNPAALQEAAYIVRHMLRYRPDVLRTMAENRVRLVVMAHNEYTTDVPEHSDLEPATYWDRRARGLGATHQRPAVSCGEENLLQFPGDPYHTENILIHEFAHAIDEMGLRDVDEKFEDRLAETFASAQAEALWKDAYAMTNMQEYWAEGVQSYFGTNRENDHDHNHVNTREELREYDPRLYALIDASFRENDWQYVWPADRPEEERVHIAGFDRAAAPEFQWRAEEE